MKPYQNCYHSANLLLIPQLPTPNSKMKIKTKKPPKTQNSFPNQILQTPKRNENSDTIATNRCKPNSEINFVDVAKELETSSSIQQEQSPICLSKFLSETSKKTAQSLPLFKK